MHPLDHPLCSVCLHACIFCVVLNKKCPLCLCVLPHNAVLVCVADWCARNCCGNVSAPLRCATFRPSPPTAPGRPQNPPLVTVTVAVAVALRHLLLLCGEWGRGRARWERAAPSVSHLPETSPQEKVVTTLPALLTNTHQHLSSHLA
jgi:hypothetical protein